MPETAIHRSVNPATTGGAMLYLYSDGRLQLARERAAELAAEYGRRKPAPEPPRRTAHERSPQPRLQLVQGGRESHESAGA
jgi:hypothetical protein